MISRLRRWFRNPLFLLGLTAFLLAFAVQAGDLGTADTTHRLQTAHSFWTSQPPVFPDEYPGFGVHGRDGKLYDWYGIGQPLLLLPFDIVGTYVEQLHIFDRLQSTSVRDMVVSYGVSMLISVLTAVVCFRFLRQLEFTVREAAAGVLALLFCTTYLHYIQNLMENNYIFLLTLTGFSFQYEWLRKGSRRALAVGSAAFGLNLLTRLTTGMDLLAGVVFLLLALSWALPVTAAMEEMPSKPRKVEWAARLGVYCRTALPIYALFAVFDRLYQYHRFGTWLTTYMTYFGAERRSMNPSLPASFPFETPFHVGFLGALISPEKSIFLFDPLLLLTILLIGIAWKHFRPQVKAFLVAALLLLLGYVCFYARYTDWSGDFAWGDRYVSSAAQLAAFISVPLLLRYRRQLNRWLWRFGLGLIAVSAAVQVASLAFWLPLEIYQMDTLGHPTFVIGLRFENIVAFALHKMDEWGLPNDSITDDPYDYIHIGTWNFLPFMARRIGEIPHWAVRMLFAVWGASLASLAAVLWRLRGSLAIGGDDPSRPSLS